MKKTIIALAVAGLSFNAAAVNLDGTVADDNIATLTFAKESVIAGVTFGKFAADADTAAEVANAITKALVIKTKAGFTLNEPHFVRIDLDNDAKFDSFGNFYTAAAGGVLGAAKVATNAGGTTATLAAGFGLINTSADNTVAEPRVGALYGLSSGGKDKSFVVFRSEDILAGQAHGVAQGDGLVVAFTAKMANYNPVKAKYTLYTNVTDATNGTNPIITKSAELLNFDNALAVSAKKATDVKQIDVASNSVKFTNDSLDSALANLNVVLKPVVAPATAPKKHDDISTAVGVADILDANLSEWVVNGDFSATSKFAAGVNQFTIAEDKKSATIKGVNVDKVTLTTNGVDFISEQAYTATFTPKVNVGSGYAVSPSAFADESIKFSKNGSSQEVQFGLSPQSGFKQYVRISNKSNVAGKVVVNVIDDNGVSVPVKLSELAAPQSDVLAKHSTAIPVEIKEFFAVANAKQALNGNGMLRLKVVGETPAGTLSVQSYSVAKDGSTFSVFN